MAADHIHGLVRGCSNSSALAMELLQSCIKGLATDSKMSIKFYLLTY